MRAFWPWALFLLAAGAAAAAAAQRFDSQTACKEFSFPEEDLSFLGPLQHVTVGNQRLAWLRVAAAAPAPADADATPLLLLLGYGATMSAWGPTLLRRLAQHRDVYLFDNMAQGLSEEVKPTEGPILPSMLEESTLGFMDALNLTRPHVAGWSLGACAALKLAAHHPDRVSKVVSWGGTSPDGRATTGSLPTLKRLFNPNNTDEDYVPLNWDTSTPSGLRGACRWITDKRRMPADEPKPDTNLRQSQGEEAEGCRGCRRIWRAIRPWDWSSWRALGKTRVPVLLMTGSEDVLVPAKASTKLAAHIPGAWLAQFPGAGHGFMWERMDDTLAVVEAFLRARPAGRRTSAGAGGGGGGGGGAAGDGPAGVGGAGAEL